MVHESRVRLQCGNTSLVITRVPSIGIVSFEQRGIFKKEVLQMLKFHIKIVGKLVHSSKSHVIY